MDEQIEGLAFRVDENEMLTGGLEDRLVEVESTLHDVKDATLRLAQTQAEQMDTLSDVRDELLDMVCDLEARMRQVEVLINAFRAFDHVRDKTET